jgi:hypothetical protein
LLPCVANDAAEQVVMCLNEARGEAADENAEKLATRAPAVIGAHAGA